MPLTVTKFWRKMTLGVGSLALASTQVLHYFLGLSIFLADVRWTGEEDLVNDPKLLSLKDDYLKMRGGRLRNIAFNANATGGGEIKMLKTFSHKIFSPEITLPYNLQVVMVGIGSATYDQIEYDLAFTMEEALGLVGGTMGLFSGFSILSGVEIVYYSAEYIGKIFSHKKKTRSCKNTF